MTPGPWDMLYGIAALVLWGYYALRVSRDPDGTWGGRAFLRLHEFFISLGPWKLDPLARVRDNAILAFLLAALLLLVFLIDPPRKPGWP